MGFVQHHDVVEALAAQRADETFLRRLAGIAMMEAADQGVSVTLMWTTRRRSCARTTKTNKTLNIAVGTTKKSTQTRLPRWLSRKVLQVCDGGLRWWTRYLDTAACEISIPSFWSSP
jgi:hypothetical protein